MTALAKRRTILEPTPLFDPPSDPWAGAEEFIDSDELVDRPFPHQRRAFLDVVDGLSRGLTSLTYVMATGSGKTHVCAYITRYVTTRLNWRVLCLAHLGELLTQARDRMARLGVDAAIEKAELDAWEEIESSRASYFKRDLRVVLGSRQTMYGKRLAKRPRDYFDMIWVDECFPAGTLVDGRPIESIRPGDRVRSFDHFQGSIQEMTVVRTMARPPSGLVRVNFADGRSIVCTPEHPFCVLHRNISHEYVPASRLTCYSMVATSMINRREINGHEEAKDVRGLRGGLHGEPGGVRPGAVLGALQVGAPGEPGQEGRHAVLQVRDRGGVQRVDRPGLRQEGPGLLLGRVQEETQVGSLVGDGIQDQSNLRIGEDEGQEPDALAGGEGEAIRDAEGDGLEAHGSRRQRQGHDGPAGDDGRRLGLEVGRPDRVGLGGGARRPDRPLPGRIGLPVLLQDRRGEPDGQGGDRDRREFPQDAPGQGEGRKEAGVLGVVRVESVEVLEPGSDGQFGGLCPGGLVYNLEVALNHNYFVDDVLVHNCHHVCSPSYMKIIGHFNKAVVIGATATDYRMDRKDIYDVFQERVFEYDAPTALADGMICPAMGLRAPVRIDLSKIKIEAGDFEESELAARIEENLKPIAAEIKKQLEGRTTIVYVPSVKVVYALADMLRDLGLRAKGTDCKNPDRHVIAQEFKRGLVDIVVNCGLYLEGYDNPRCDAVVLARPTRSRGMISQMVGRSLRKGKPNALVLDFDWQLAEHDIVSLADVFAKPGHTPEVLRLARLKMTEGEADPTVALAKSEEEIAEMKRLQAEKLKNPCHRLRVSGKGALPTGYDFTTFDLFGDGTKVLAPPSFDPGTRKATDKPATRDMIQKLVNFKFPLGQAEQLTTREATRMLANFYSRSRGGQSSYAQVQALKRWGVDPAVGWTLSRKEAGQMMDTLIGQKDAGSRY